MIELLKRGFEEEINARDLADALRTHTPESVEQLAAELDSFLRAVPDAIAAAVAMTKDRRCGRAVAFATGAILNYLFDEDDLLPESSFGAIGLLDDAYLVHAFVAMLRQTFPFVEPAASYAAPEARVFDVVASLLPEGISQALLRTCESTIQVAQSLFVPADGAIGETQVRADLRVTDALRALA